LWKRNEVTDKDFIRHARIYIDVKDEKGVAPNWNVELGGPLQLNRLGWKRDSVKVGDQIKVDGYMAKDGSKMANARNVVFADGRKVFSGSSGDGGPAQWLFSENTQSGRFRCV
jgi:hypothetical protein